MQSVASTVEDFAVDTSDPAFAAFQSVFTSFQDLQNQGQEVVESGPSKGEIYYSDEEDEDEESRERARLQAQEQEGLTRRQRRAAAKLSVAELKQLVDRPEVVEWFDADARDPRLLVNLKSYRKCVARYSSSGVFTDISSVPVPVHWNAKRDYLAGKRGIEKPPYLLPRESYPSTQ